MIELPRQVRKIINLLEKAGHEAYAVGGAVRDSLLGIIPTDWDIATSATPQEMMEVFAEYKTIPTGIEHGTITLLMEGEPFELTTFRIDGAYRDGRRPDAVTFSSSLYEDVKRRDFTINAMAYHPQKGLFDFFKGQEDLKNKIVSCVGEVATRFSEDYLRMVRAYRMAAVLNFSVTRDIELYVEAHQKNLYSIAMERLQMETIKTFQGPKSDKTVEYIHLFSFILFPTFRQLEAEAQDIALKVFLLSTSLSESLASLYYLLGAGAAKKDLENLRFSNDIIDSTIFLVRHVDAPMPTSVIEMKQSLAQWGILPMKALIDFWEIIFLASDKAIDNVEKMRAIVENIIEIIDPFSLKDLAVNGGDLLSFFSEPGGKWVGECLFYLLNQVIICPEKNKKELLLTMAQIWKGENS